MGNSLDCGLGDCGSPDDAESSDYSKPVEYDQVRIQRPRRFKFPPWRVCSGALLGVGAGPWVNPGLEGGGTAGVGAFD